MIRVRTIIVASLLVAFVGAADAAPRLKALMNDWKAQANAADAMLANRAAYNEAGMRRILETFVGDARDLQTRASGTSAAARDVKARFARFELVASAGLDQLGQPDEIKRRVVELRGECRSCHDLYKN